MGYSMAILPFYMHGVLVWPFCGVQMEYAGRVDEGKESKLQLLFAPSWLDCCDREDSLLGMHVERVYINCPGLNGSILRGYLPAIQVKCERRVGKGSGKMNAHPSLYCVA